MGNSIVITAVMGPPVAAGLHVPARSPGGDLVSWHSTDGGKTWSDGALVNDVPAAANEGLHALGSDGHGKIFAAWLDKRSGHGTRLYGASSTNGITWSKNVLIYESPDGTICECCHPSVGIDSKGQIVVMWRNALGGNRDLYLARSADGVKFSKAEKLGTGSWKLNACPMDGGGIAISGDRIVTAWRREHDLFLASPGGAETRLGSGMDVGIAGDARGVYAIWSSPSGIQAATAGKAPVTLAASGAFPTIVALADGRVLAAWEEDGKISIQPVR